MNAEAVAAAAALRYVNDNEPGISRHRAGRGFCYRLTDGALLREKAILGRIGELAIPPAWTDVWICLFEDGHLQATGRDQRGRKQYRYHPAWSEDRGRTKFAQLYDFAASLPKLRKRIDADLSLRGQGRDKIVASVVWLLDNTLIRVGNAAYARENGSFGLTTLRQRHLEITGSTLRFDFKGKSGKSWRLAVSDRRIARVLRGVQDLPGQNLFQYLDDDGERRAIASQDVNSYIQAVIGEQFTSKDFRTWGGSTRALDILGGTLVPDTRTARARALNDAIDRVAARLGNTRAVCRSCYIHPKVLQYWETGVLPDQIAVLRAKRPRRKGLDSEESLTLRWLEDFGAD